MITQLNRLMTPKSSYRRSRLAPRLIKAIVEAKVGELQGSLFQLTREKDNLQRSIVNGVVFFYLCLFYLVKKKEVILFTLFLFLQSKKRQELKDKKDKDKKKRKSNNERSTTRE